MAVVTMLLGQHGFDPLIPALESKGVRVFEARVGARAYLKERAAVREVCEAFQPDVVHTHGYRTDVVDRGVAARMGIATVTTVHGPDMSGGLKGAFYEWIQRLNYRRFDAVVAVSSALRKASMRDGVPPDRLYTIPNAWTNLRPPLSWEDARAKLGLDSDVPVVGWVGRLLHVKGADVFLDALHRLPEPRPEVVIIGQGKEQNALEVQAERLGLDRTVHFFGDVPDAGRLFSAFDTFVLSSRSEGLPIVLLEAMAARAPIVATRVGGVPEAVGEGEALLVPPNDPAALAAAIRESIKDRVAAQARADQAAQRLEERFAMEPWLKRYEDVYREVVRRN